MPILHGDFPDVTSKTFIAKIQKNCSADYFLMRFGPSMKIGI